MPVSHREGVLEWIADHGVEMQLDSDYLRSETRNPVSQKICLRPEFSNSAVALTRLRRRPSL